MSWFTSKVPPPACRHAQYFANAEGQYTVASLTEQQKKLGVQGFGADLRTKAILQLGDTPRKICQIVNTARSGIWNTDGTFNQERFNQLEQLAVEDVKGDKVVTKTIFDQFLYEIHGWGWSGIMVWLTSFPFIPITYHQVTEASVDDFFKQFADSEFGGRPAISISRLHTFYNEPQTVMAQVEKKHRDIDS